METQYVSRDPEVMSVALCFKGTRMTVRSLLGYLEVSPSLDDFREDFPSISHEAAIAVVEVARECLFAHASAA